MTALHFLASHSIRHGSAAAQLQLLLLMAPTASPSPAPVVSGIPNAWPAAAAVNAERAFTWLNTNAIVVLALLICGLVATIALHVVLQCARRVTVGAWYGSGALQEPAPRAGVGQHGGGRKREALIHALPCLVYSAGLELAGSSRSDCGICLAEFERAEQVRVLPRCNHWFHACCIDRWLAARPTCPACRQAPFADPEPALVDRARPAVVAMVRVIVDGGDLGRRVELERA